ncbi:MAG: hypothetical protein GY828_06695, partial [Candidatus Gracilibacteria bacterium]|nr:hypothetical protein [Candidatus Gracilibacteria bacterium]MCP4523874.1 hypothetical protein [Candidatus Gracilibacteria bacterium]
RRRIKQEKLEAFARIKASPVKAIFNAFVKLLGKPIPKSGKGSHMKFLSPITGRTFPFSYHGSSGTNNIGIGLLCLYIKYSGLDVREIAKNI